MNIASIVIKTIATTIDLLVAGIVLLDSRNPDTARKVITIVTLLNLAGVWI